MTDVVSQLEAQVIGAIPLDLEIIVQVAFRYRRAEFALPTGWIERFRVRSPAELEHAVDEMHAATAHGILAVVHGAAAFRATQEQETEK